MDVRGMAVRGMAVRVMAVRVMAVCVSHVDRRAVLFYWQPLLPCCLCCLRLTFHLPKKGDSVELFQSIISNEVIMGCSGFGSGSATTLRGLLLLPAGLLVAEKGRCGGTN